MSDVDEITFCAECNTVSIGEPECTHEVEPAGVIETVKQMLDDYHNKGVN